MVVIGGVVAVVVGSVVAGTASVVRCLEHVSAEFMNKPNVRR